MGCSNDVNNAQGNTTGNIMEGNFSIPNYSISISQSSADMIRKLEPS